MLATRARVVVVVVRWGNRAVASGLSAGGRGEDGRLGIVTAVVAGLCLLHRRDVGVLGWSRPRHDAPHRRMFFLVGEVIEIS